MVAAPLFASALSLLAGGNATGSGSHAGPELGLDGLPSPTEQVAPEVEEARTASGFLAMFVCLGVLVVGTLVVVAMRRARSSVPEAWVFTFCGAVIAAVIWSGASEQLQLIRSAVHDSFSGIFFSALLPVVIFESGYSMHRESFFQHFWPISTYALLGTLLSTAVVSMFMWIQGALGLGFEWSALDASIFGTVASATDPVTVLAVFTALRVDRQLYALVFGEAVLNDAVAIVLFHTLMSFHGQTSLSFGTVLGGVLSFLTTFLGSTLIGVGVAASTALLFKHLRPDATLAGLERALITLLPFSAYFLAEGLQLSGVVAILFTGVGMAHYTRRNLTQPTRAFSLALFSVMAFICEALVFVYIGLSLPMLVQPGLLGMWSTLLGSVVACLVGRAVHVYACTALINAQAGPQDPRHVPPTHAFVMWFSGLRGGTAFALSAAARSVLPDAAAAQVMEGASLFIVLLSLAVIGGGIGPLVRAKRLFGVALHRVASMAVLLAVLPLQVAFPILAVVWLVDACMLHTRVKAVNGNRYGARKYMAEAYIQALLPPFSLLGGAHWYLRNWSRACVMAGTLGGGIVWAVWDLVRLPQHVSTANHRIPRQYSVGYEARKFLVRLCWPTLRAWCARTVTQDVDLADAVQRRARRLVATAAQQGDLLHTPEPELDQSLVSIELEVLSLLPPAGLLGCNHCLVGEPRLGCLHACTCGALGVGYIVDLGIFLCLHDRHVEHANIRQRAQAAGIPSPREVLKGISLWAAWLGSGLVGGHHFILGNWWMAAAYVCSLGGFGVLWLMDGLYLLEYLNVYSQAREREVMLVRAAEKAHQTGCATLVVTPPQSAQGEVRDEEEGGGDAPRPLRLVLLGGNQHSLARAYNRLHSQHTVHVSATVAWACWLPVGGLLGLHHYYLGRTAHGLLATCTLNFLGVGWIVDACFMASYLQAAMREGGVVGPSRTGDVLLHADEGGRTVLAPPSRPTPCLGHTTAQSSCPDPAPPCTPCRTCGRVGLATATQHRPCHSTSASRPPCPGHTHSWGRKT